MRPSKRNAVILPHVFSLRQPQGLVIVYHERSLAESGAIQADVV
jgi:hypothetical protein